MSGATLRSTRYLSIHGMRKAIDPLAARHVQILVVRASVMAVGKVLVRPAASAGYIHRNYDNIILSAKIFLIRLLEI